MSTRIFTDIFIFLAILFLPPIFPMVIALFSLYYYESFYEIIFAGIIIDALYGRPIANLYDFSHLMAFISVILFISSIFIKKRLKFYSDK
ncbi:MAG: hypothetical protein AAB781_00820 [Patescibacteria group bacterium]